MASWLLFLFRLPPQPSAPRVAVWRALKRLPGKHLQHGVFATRHSQVRLMELKNLAHDVRNYGGNAVVVETAKVDGEDALSPVLKPRTPPPRIVRNGRRALAPLPEPLGAANASKPGRKKRRVASL